MLSKLFISFISYLLYLLSLKEIRNSLVANRDVSDNTWNEDMVTDLLIKSLSVTEKYVNKNISSTLGKQFLKFYLPECPDSLFGEGWGPSLHLTPRVSALVLEISTIVNVIMSSSHSSREEYKKNTPVLRHEERDSSCSMIVCFSEILMEVVKYNCEWKIAIQHSGLIQTTSLQNIYPSLKSLSPLNIFLIAYSNWSWSVWFATDSWPVDSLSIVVWSVLCWVWSLTQPLLSPGS